MLLAGAAVIGYSLLRKTAGLGTLNFFPEKFRSIKFDGLTPVAEIGIGVQNTSNQSFTLNSLAGNAYANGSYVGVISSFVPTEIRPNSEAIIMVKIRMQLVGIVNNIVTAFQNKHITQDVKLQMSANIDNLQVPIDLTYKVGL